MKKLFLWVLGVFALGCPAVIRAEIGEMGDMAYPSSGKAGPIIWIGCIVLAIVVIFILHLRDKKKANG